MVLGQVKMAAVDGGIEAISCLIELSGDTVQGSCAADSSLFVAQLQHVLARNSRLGRPTQLQHT